jgi:hypothetical protein
VSYKSRDNFQVSACFGECTNRDILCDQCLNKDKRRMPSRQPDADKIGCEADQKRLDSAEM